MSVLNLSIHLPEVTLPNLRNVIWSLPTYAWWWLFLHLWGFGGKVCRVIPCLSFFFFFFQQRSAHKHWFHFFRSGSVHNGSPSRDDWCMVQSLFLTSMYVWLLFLFGTEIFSTFLYGFFDCPYRNGKLTRFWKITYLFQRQKGSTSFSYTFSNFFQTLKTLYKPWAVVALPT